MLRSTRSRTTISSVLGICFAVAACAAPGAEHASNGSGGDPNSRADGNGTSLGRHEQTLADLHDFGYAELEQDQTPSYLLRGEEDLETLLFRTRAVWSDAIQALDVPSAENSPREHAVYEDIYEAASKFSEAMEALCKGEVPGVENSAAESRLDVLLCSIKGELALTEALVVALARAEDASLTNENGTRIGLYKLLEPAFGGYYAESADAYSVSTLRQHAVFPYGIESTQLTLLQARLDAQPDGLLATAAAFARAVSAVAYFTDESAKEQYEAMISFIAVRALRNASAHLSTTWVLREQLYGY